MALLKVLEPCPPEASTAGKQAAWHRLAEVCIKSHPRSRDVEIVVECESHFTVIAKHDPNFMSEEMADARAILSDCFPYGTVARCDFADDCLVVEHSGPDA